MNPTNEPRCSIYQLEAQVFRDEILEYLDHESISTVMTTLPEGPPFHLHDHFCYLHGRRFTNIMEAFNLVPFASEAAEHVRDVTGNSYSKNDAEWLEEQDNVDERCRYTEWMEKNPICSRPANCQECYLIFNNHERCHQCNNAKVWNDFKACSVCGQGRCCTSCALGDGYNMVQCKYCENMHCLDCHDSLETAGRCHCCNRTIILGYDYDYDALQSTNPQMLDAPVTQGTIHDSQCW